MDLDINTAEDGRWFTFFYSHLDPNTSEPIYDDPIENGPQMKIRNPAPFWKEQSEKKKMETRMVVNPKTHVMNAVQVEVKLTPEQQKAEHEGFVDYTIQGVKQFKLNGKEMKATLQDKVKAFENPLVSMFVVRCVQILQESGIQEVAAETKNS